MIRSMPEEQPTQEAETQRAEVEAEAAKQRDRQRTSLRETFSDEDNPLICRGID